jgi:iron complex transport system ATP-binding protein
MGASLIHVNELCLFANRKRILDDVSFHLHPGEWVSVIGPNGAGKSTLLKAILRLMPYQCGEVFLNGKNLLANSLMELSRQIAYVPQSPAADVPFTVSEFVMTGRFAHQSRWRGPGKADRKIVESVIELAGVQHLRLRRLSELSGGERQNVFIAAALAQETDILFLDEPTAFLDPGQKRRIQISIERLHRETGKTIVSVTHDVNAAAHGPTRVLGLREGRLIFDGPGSGLMDEEVLESVFETTFSLAVHPETGKTYAMPEVLC